MKNSHVKNRVIKGVGSSFFYQTVLAAQAVILVPFFLKAWGAEGYGRWLTLTAFVSYLALLDLGGQVYFANKLAVAFAKKDTKDFFQKLSEGLSLFLFLGLSCFGIWISIILIAGKWSITGLNRTLHLEEIWILVFMGASFLLFSNVGGVYATVYRATGHFVRGTMISSIIRVIGIFFSIGFLYIQIDPVFYAIYLFVFGGVLTSFIFWDSGRILEGNNRSIEINLKNAQKGLTHLKGSLYFWVLAISQAVKQHGTILILASTASPVFVSIFSTHRILSNFSSYVGILFRGPILPELSFLWANKKNEKLLEVILSSVKGIIILTGLVSIFIWLIAPIFFPIWTEGKIIFVPELLLLLLAQGVLGAGGQTSCWGLIATNHHRLFALCSLGGAFLSLLLVFYLAPIKGMIGAAWAGLLGEVLTGLLIFPALASKFFRISFLKTWKPIASSILILFFLCAIVFEINSVVTEGFAIALFFGVLIVFLKFQKLGLQKFLASLKI
jgi:O-antigen/teichoic acid export membrane protein